MDPNVDQREHEQIVVDFDLRCRNDDAWYRKNRTQPVRDQPWYHVLVDGSTLFTYAAESSLEPNATGEPIDHPLVPELFAVPALAFDALLNAQIDDFLRGTRPTK